jgi:hypothetical protein
VFFLATHAACGSVSETSFGGLPLLPLPFEPRECSDSQSL